MQSFTTTFSLAQKLLVFKSTEFPPRNSTTINTTKIQIAQTFYREKIWFS